jgi:hypothetical protein
LYREKYPNGRFSYNRLESEGFIVKSDGEDPLISVTLEFIAACFKASPKLA